MNIKIAGSGSYIPTITVKNEDFSSHQFLSDEGLPLHHTNDIIISKFRDITGIEERRYAERNLLTSDIASLAAEKAIDDAKIDKETLDYIIVAHNFGDLRHGAIQSDTVPSIAARVKQKLKIQNPKCVAYDVLFGCPGWIEGMIQANAFVKAGIARNCLVIGAETLSRVVDIHDRDAMIYSDGAGATVVTASNDDSGVLAHESATYAANEAGYLYFGKSFNKDLDPDVRYLKMFGRKIYEFALNHVPMAMKSCLEKSGVPISKVSKILIHQANEKMDEAIIQRFYKLYDQSPPPGIMPMSIHKLGNSSVATVPTLFDLLVHNKLDKQSLNKGDVVIMASVGAGMNINSLIYRH
ncbi:MAG: ketoacyl-ACP synthase III [Flavobacterium sp.]|nr:MAG: ketoacyl-ACP synthase III [Flavobacterium sp.]